MATNAERLDLIKKEIERWEQTVIDRKTHYRKWAVIVTISISVLSASASIILGLHVEKFGDWPRIVSLIMTAIISVFSTVSSFFNYKELWVVNDTAKFKLGRLKFNIDLLQTRDNLNEEMVQGNRDRLEEILSELNSQWKKKRE